MLFSATALLARPVDESKAKDVALKFFASKTNNNLRTNDLQLVYTGTSTRGEACFYVYNAGTTGFVIVSADDRFRPIVGYSVEGAFATENPSPELMFYLDKIIEARTSRNAVLLDNTEAEWQSVMDSGKLLSRNGGRGVDIICQTKWNQDSPYNLYAPEATGGPGGRCYAGCVATAMSQIMKRWDYPEHGTGSHTYNAGGWWGPSYPNLSANFGATYYNWKNMPERLGANSTDEQIDAVATLMYHCGVSVNMGFASDGSGANSEDVPSSIRQYFSYSSHATLKSRSSYSLTNWQNLLKDSFDLGWPIYYSGYSDEGGHAFVCDGYDDDNLFHYNWGWGGSGDGWFVVDEIDFATWAQAIINFVPSDVYDYMPMEPSNFSVTPSGDFNYTATLHWTNPNQNIHLSNLNSLDKVVVTRNGEIIYTVNNPTPGGSMTYTDHYIPAIVDYAVYAVSHDAKGQEAVVSDVLLGPTCDWTVQATSSAGGWNGGALSFVNTHGDEVANVTLTSTSTTKTVRLPYGHVDIQWLKPTTAIEHLTFNIKNSSNQTKVSFDGSSADITQGMFYIANNTCDATDANFDGPQNLTATQSGNNVTLTWEALIGREVIHYQVYRDNLIYAITSNTSYTYAEYENVFHNYRVAALTQDGETRSSNVCNLQPSVQYNSPTNLRCEISSPTKAKLSWDAPTGDGLRGYMVFRRPKGGEFKRIKLLSGTTYTDNLGSQPDSQYEYAVCACFTTDNIQTAYASSQEHPELNFVSFNKSIIPMHLDFIIHEGFIHLNWEEATMAQSYNVYRNGERIAQGVTDTFYIDYEATSSQTYSYVITGNTDFIESSPSNEVYIDWTTDVNEQGGLEEINIYPNPTQNKVYIEAEGLRQVRVFNMMGQEVLNQAVEGSSFVLDLSSQPQGCYFIETKTEQGSTTTKIMRL